MNNYDWIRPRHRHRQLIIVEGRHEKNELMQLLKKCFPEIEVEFNDIIIYATNIYGLYHEIEENYDERWEETEIDLPYIISKKKGWDVLSKYEFTSILLFFDYERHEPNFSEEKVIIMQRYFNDATDAGQLYLNYPMVESYQDLSEIPDNDYFDRKIPVSLQPGKKYKSLVKNTVISKAVLLPVKLDEILWKRFLVCDIELRSAIVEQLLCIDCHTNLINKIEMILKDALSEKKLSTAKYQIAATLRNYNYIDSGCSYYTYMRKLFCDIICHNILKSYKIQNGNADFCNLEIKDVYRNVDFMKILSKQNELSRNPISGFIWVLNTCVMMVPEYNFNLLNTDGYPL